MSIAEQWRDATIEERQRAANRPVARAIEMNLPVGDETPVERIRFDLPDGADDYTLDPLAVGGAETPLVGGEPDPDCPALSVHRVNADAVESATRSELVVKPVDVVEEPWASRPLAAVPEWVEVPETDREAMQRVDEYSRKGHLAVPARVTRQQWIEDFLGLGFTGVEERKAGKAPMRLRLSHPTKADANGRALFYEVQHPAEMRYVRARLAQIVADTGGNVSDLPSLLRPEFNIPKLCLIAKS